MKRTFALLLTALLALSLTACGNYDGNSTNNTTPDTSVKDSGVSGNGTSSTTPNTATGTGLTKNVYGTRVDNGATGTSTNAADNRVLGLQNGVASVPKPAINNNGKTATAVPQSGNTNVIRGATYGQMLRNARVHDRDGFLLDGENAVTPGAAYR